MAAVMSGGAGALASHLSAAALWELDGMRPGPVEISVKTGKRIVGAQVHRRLETDDPLVVVRQGISSTGIERTLLDIASLVSPARAGLALDDALRRDLVTVDRLRALVEGQPKGRPGTRALTQLLLERDSRDGRMESRLEAKMLRLLRRSGLELPIPQYEVRTGDLLVARVDFAYPAQRIAIETDGYRWHGGPERWKKDMRRENRLKLLGWTVLRFSWEDVHSRPEAVVGQVRAALGGQLPGIDSRVAWAYTPSRMTELQPRT
jgi:very-short-patch-repair endonuclease